MKVFNLRTALEARGVSKNGPKVVCVELLKTAVVDGLITLPDHPDVVMENISGTSFHPRAY